MVWDVSVIEVGITALFRSRTPASGVLEGSTAMALLNGQGPANFFFLSVPDLMDDNATHGQMPAQINARTLFS
jgi:hypothetical protein